MKNPFLIPVVVFVLLCISCNNPTKPDPQNEELTQNEETAEVEEQYWSWCDLSEEEQEAKRNKYLSKYNFNQKYTLKAIDDELGMLFEDWNNLDTCWFYAGFHEYFRSEVLVPLIRERMEVHLKNPITFYNNLPRVGSLIGILKTPDEKCKIYCFDVQSGGNIIKCATYFQYKDNSGRMAIYQYDCYWQDDYCGYCDTLFQFNSKGKNYYLIEITNSWNNLYIFSIDNGVFTYHDEFFGDNQRERSLFSERASFNPETKTVSFVNEEDKEGKIVKVKYSYKLVE